MKQNCLYTKIKTKILTEKNYVNKMDYEMVAPMLTPCVGNKPEETVSENTAKKTEDSIEKAPSQHFPNSSSKSLLESIKEIATKGTSEEKIKFLDSLKTSLTAKEFSKIAKRSGLL